MEVQKCVCTKRYLQTNKVQNTHGGTKHARVNAYVMYRTAYYILIRYKILVKVQNSHGYVPNGLLQTTRNIKEIKKGLAGTG